MSFHGVSRSCPAKEASGSPRASRRVPSLFCITMRLGFEDGALVLTGEIGDKAFLGGVDNHSNIFQAIALALEEPDCPRYRRRHVDGF
jgi:hypothetical protein